MTRRELRVGGDHAELLLAREDPLTARVPPVVELARVLVRPLLRHVVRRVRRTRREVGEERLVRHQRLLLADPPDRLVGHVAHQVVALVGRAVGLDRRRALIQRRVVLVRLAADEPVEVLEAAAAGRPVVERPQRARLPHRHLVALAELRGRVPVELEDLRQRRARVRPHRVVPRRGRRDLRDPAHPHRVVIAAAQQRRPRRRAQRRRMEAIELQATRRQALRVRGCARPPERARRTEPDIVEQDHQHVRRPLRRPQRLDRRERRIRILGVIRHQPGWRDIRDRQHLTLDQTEHRSSPSGRSSRFRDAWKKRQRRPVTRSSHHPDRVILDPATRAATANDSRPVPRMPAVSFGTGITGAVFAAIVRWSASMNDGVVEVPGSGLPA